MPLNLAERPGAWDIADADLFDQKHRKPKLMSRNFLQHLNTKSSGGGMERLSSGLKGWGEHVSGWERLAGKHVAQLQWFESGDGEESSKKAKVKVMEGSSKRAGTELEQESSKMQKIDDDIETAEQKQLVKIIPDEKGVAIDAIPLAVKPPSIVDRKIHKEKKKLL
nr:hypothetical protein [Tanacetum cinerariifolium]